MSVRVANDYREALGDRGELRYFAPGEVIFEAGDPGDGFHVVVSGRVGIRAGGRSGEVIRPLATIAPGDFFGEMAILDEGVRSATAVAEVATCTRFLGREPFLALLHEQPDFAFRLIRAFSARLRATNARYLEDLLHHERLATVGRLARATVHDFKNPLAVISLAAEMLAQPGLGPDGLAQASRSILVQVAQMNSLLHELIDYTREGRTPALFGWMDFTAFLRSELDVHAPELASRGVTLRIVGDLPPVRLRGEPRRLSRLLRNLLNNAIEAIDGSCGVIALTVRREPGLVRVELSDSGRGIAPEIAPRLFEPFATFGKAHGTGLGLSICKRIVEDHGGRIEAANGSDGGARFTFTLPVADA